MKRHLWISSLGCILLSVSVLSHDLAAQEQQPGRGFYKRPEGLPKVPARDRDIIPAPLDQAQSRNQGQSQARDLSQSREQDRDQSQSREQDRMREGERGGGRGAEQGDRMEALMDRLAENPRLAEELGLDAQALQALRARLEELRTKHAELNEAMEAAAMKQARLMSARPPDEDAVIAAAREMGGLRTEIGVLNIQRLLLMQKHVKPENMERMREHMKERIREHVKERLQERSQEGGGESRQGLPARGLLDRPGADRPGMERGKDRIGPERGMEGNRPEMKDRDAQQKRPLSL